MFKFECYSETNVGNIRKNNEDNFFTNGVFKNRTDTLNFYVSDTSNKKENLYAVCDGMGGEAFGEDASYICVSSLCDYYGMDFNSTVLEYLEKTNNKICDFILKNNGLQSGSTFAALYANKKTATSYNIGDSRIYIHRDTKLRQLSVDHTLANQMLKVGMITPEEAKFHKSRHVLTQHLGVFPDEIKLTVHKSETINLKNNDIFILCSDGLTDMVDDTEIEKIINLYQEPSNIARILIDTALNNGGRDNVTVQVIKYTKKLSFLYK